MTVKVYTWEIQKEGKRYSRHSDTVLALKNISSLKSKIIVEADIGEEDNDLKNIALNA